MSLSPAPIRRALPERQRKALIERIGEYGRASAVLLDRLSTTDPEAYDELVAMVTRIQREVRFATTFGRCSTAEEREDNYQPEEHDKETLGWQLANEDQEEDMGMDVDVDDDDDEGFGHLDGWRGGGDDAN